MMFMADGIPWSMTMYDKHSDNPVVYPMTCMCYHVVYVAIWHCKCDLWGMYYPYVCLQAMAYDQICLLWVKRQYMTGFLHCSWVAVTKQFCDIQKHASNSLKRMHCETCKNHSYIIPPHRMNSIQ